MNIWKNFHLSHRVVILSFSAIFIVLGGLGLYLYFSTKQALESKADFVSARHLKRFSILLDDLHDLRRSKANSASLEDKLRKLQDVRLSSRDGKDIYIHNGRASMVLSNAGPLEAVDFFNLNPQFEGVSLLEKSIQHPAGIADFRPRAETLALEEVYMTEAESEILQKYKSNLIAAIGLCIVGCSLIIFAVLTKGLRPVKQMRDQAEKIFPANLSNRLCVEGAPPEFIELGNSVNAMLDRLETGYEHIAQFSANLAHEIRTPVNILMGQTLVMLGTVREVEEYEDVLESNLEELARLSRIIENVLFLANADHTTLKIERTEFVTAEELRKVVEYFESLAEEQKMHLSLHATGICYANFIMWQRGINNLIANAIRHGKPGTTISIVAESSDQGAFFTIENSCEPISEALLNCMFQRFYRGEKACRDFTGSNGLGLSMVRAIARLHEGTVNAAYFPDKRIIRFQLHFPHAPL